jgi:hypothetical protein
VIILLPLLRRLNARARLFVGVALTTVGLFLIIAALAHGVIAVMSVRSSSSASALDGSASG